MPRRLEQVQGPLHIDGEALLRILHRFLNGDQRGVMKDGIAVRTTRLAVACLGNIAQSKGEPIIHAHITFTGVKGEVIGGHLVEGCRVNPTAELTLLKGTGTLRRKIVEKYQLALLEF